MSYGTNAPFGMQPRKHLNGSVWNGQVSTFQISDAYATSLFTGDPVTLGSGYLAIGVAGSAIIGVFQGCQYKTSTGTQTTFAPYWPASTATSGTVGALAFVCVDQTVLYDMQMNASTIVQASIGMNANFVANSGSTVSGQSGYAIDNTTLATGNATRNLKIMELVPRPGNDYGVTYNNAYVMINNNVFNSGTGTVGV